MGRCAINLMRAACIRSPNSLVRLTLSSASEVGDDAAFFPVAVAGGIRAVAAAEFTRAGGGIGGFLGAAGFGLGQGALGGGG